MKFVGADQVTLGGGNELVGVGLWVGQRIGVRLIIDVKGSPRGIVGLGMVGGDSKLGGNRMGTRVPSGNASIRLFGGVSTSKDIRLV